MPTLKQLLKEAIEETEEKYEDLLLCFTNEQMKDQGAGESGNPVAYSNKFVYILLMEDAEYFIHPVERNPGFRTKKMILNVPVKMGDAVFQVMIESEVDDGTKA